MYKLIGDSGSTKTDWCLVDPQDQQTKFTTEGYNPYLVNRQYIINSIYNSFPKLDFDQVDELYFYGAGCTPERIPIVRDALTPILKRAKILVDDDLLAAARALLKDSVGFAAILGTGMNSCIYNGHKISRSIHSLGYLLGDEGSGNAIGRRVIADYVRGHMPENTAAQFYEIYHKAPNEVFEETYSSKIVNRYMATYAGFLSQPDIDQSYTEQLLKDEFALFFKRIICHYPEYQTLKFNCVGAIGFYFRDTLKQVAESFGMELGRVIPSVIDDLVNYHSKKHI